ncbi:response regulator [Deinococcus hopiensis]|uniref:Response regulator containing a CheY-like receiver domain and an HTH DNA-binding domain n=1 Tax=Deinococcus hopiensis KR-140 TaxID=695939 RepID=A0A1W1V8M7_9DEIO|nr:response regulator [Deinococcus hopiensis]SMB89708.1 Response regulator containing a CheY-like receiver domain and an HTH DNA-binding domain [Deinococcus hopiensis KR-140]
MAHRRILLVDDNPKDVELTLTALEDELGAHDVTVAGSGVEALDLLQNAPLLPDLILLDLNMPQMDGLAVLDAIRAEQTTRDIPVVMLTTSGENRDVRESYQHGASAYVVKPMDFGQFRDAIRTITDFWTQLNRRPQLR